MRAAGGVFTGDHALAMLRAGADAIELYSAFFYRGWDVAGRINSELLAAMEREGLHRLSSLRDASTGPVQAVATSRV